MIYAKFYKRRTTKWNDVIFRYQSCTPYLKEGLGSDSVFILDGRNNLQNMIYDCRQRMKRLEKVQHYVHFEIRRGDLRETNPEVIYKSCMGEIK